MKLQRPLFLIAILIAIFPAAILQAGATDTSDQCPRFQFNPPDAYKGNMKYSFLAPGSAGPKVESFTSVCPGFWLSAASVRQNWRITVSKKDDPKVAGPSTQKMPTRLISREPIRGTPHLILTPGSKSSLFRGGTLSDISSRQPRTPLGPSKQCATYL
jgi:hypothetical protein